MLEDITSVRREVDLEVAARTDLAVQGALTEGAERLAKAIVHQACLDLLAARHPSAAKKYMRDWRKYDAKNSYISLEAWARIQQRELRAYFTDGGGELAMAAGCYDLVSKAMTRKRLWNSVNQRLGV